MIIYSGSFGGTREEYPEMVQGYRNRLIDRLKIIIILYMENFSNGENHHFTPAFPSLKRKCHVICRLGHSVEDCPRMVNLLQNCFSLIPKQHNTKERNTTQKCYYPRGANIMFIIV